MSGCESHEPYALQVLGDSMEPEFEDGSIIVIENNVAVEDGCYVLAHHDDEFIFRQLIKTDDRWHLNPLNQNYPAIAINDLSGVRGRIVSKTSSRGRDRKSYLK